MTDATAHLEAIANEREQQTATGTQDLFTRISGIERRHPAPRDRAAAFLDAIVDSFGALAGSATIAAGGEEHDLRHAGTAEGTDAWVGTVTDAALEARSHAKTIARLFADATGAPRFALIACPIDAAGRDPFGGISVLVRCGDVPEAERIQLHIRSACLHAAGMLSRPSARRESVEMDDIARIYTRAGQFKDLHEFAYAITNAARQRFDCDQAAMGQVRRGKVSLLCISGLDTIKKRSPGVHRIEQAMGECADANEPVVSQPSGEWDSAGFARDGKLHLRWRAAADNASVISLPVLSGDETVAVLSFRRRGDRPFDADDLTALQKLLAPLGGAVPLVTRSTLPLHRHAAQSIGDAVAWLTHRGSFRKRALAVLATGAACWFALSPSSYHIHTNAVVKAQREHIVAAPLDALVAAVLVRAGDRVVAGQPLLRMDTTALEFEAREVAATLAATEARLHSATAEGDTAGAAVANAERRAHSVRLAGINRRIANAVVTAPVAGTIIGDELSEAEGRLVSTGLPLLSIAEAGALTLEVRVPEQRVADIRSGQNIRFASHARPDTPGHTDLATIAPAAVERDGKQVFVAEAPLPDAPDWLRPGMEGVAIIDAGERPNWWLATHRLTDTARLRFWID